MLLNVKDFAAPQHALDAAKDGDRVYFPSGFGPYDAPPGGFVVRRNLEIFGDGAGSAGSPDGTTFRPGGVTDNDHVFKLSPLMGMQLENLYFHDFKITKRPEIEGLDGSSGIYCMTVAGVKTSQLRAARVVILNLRKNGFHLEGADSGDGAIVAVSLHGCFASLCGENGLYMKNVFHSDSIGSGFFSNQKSGAYCEFSGVAFYQTVFENNCAAIADAASLHGNLTLNECHTAAVDACHFEKLHQGARKAGIVVRLCGGSARIAGCFFAGLAVLPQSPEPSTGIVVLPHAANGPITIGTNRFHNITTLMDIGEVPDLVVMPQFNQDADYTLTIAGAQDGLTGVPHVNRGNVLLEGNVRSGLAVPAGASLPTGALRDGMLAYDSTAHILKMRKAAAQGGWLGVSEGILGTQLAIHTVDLNRMNYMNTNVEFADPGTLQLAAHASQEFDLSLEHPVSNEVTVSYTGVTPSLAPALISCLLERIPSGAITAALKGIVANVFGDHATNKYYLVLHNTSSSSAALASLRVELIFLQQPYI